MSVFSTSQHSRGDERASPEQGSWSDVKKTNKQNKLLENIYYFDVGYFFLGTTKVLFFLL